MMVLHGFTSCQIFNFMVFTMVLRWLHDGFMMVYSTFYLVFLKYVFYKVLHGFTGF